MGSPAGCACGSWHRSSPSCWGRPTIRRASERRGPQPSDRSQPEESRVLTPTCVVHTSAPGNRQYTDDIPGPPWLVNVSSPAAPRTGHLIDSGGRARSSVWLERPTHNRLVGGSRPPGPTLLRLRLGLLVWTCWRSRSLAATTGRGG